MPFRGQWIHSARRRSDLLYRSNASCDDPDRQMTDTSDDEIGDPSADPVRPRYVQWALLVGDRTTVAVGIAGVTFLAVALLAFLGVVGLRSSRMMWYLNGTINGLLTLIPIAVGINQIILSQELDPISDFYERLDDTVEFRWQVEDRTGTEVSSPQASAFCADLFVGLRDEAAAFGEACTESDDADLQRDAAEYARNVENQADAMARTMDDLGDSLVPTFLALLDFQDTEQFHRTRVLRNEYDESLPDDAADSLDRILELFEDIDTTREYLKTLSIQRELARLSGKLLYTGMAAIVVAGLAILGYRSSPALALSNASLTVVAGGVFAVTLSPLAILVSHMLRVATVARRTAAFGPFRTPEERRRSRRQNE